MVRAAPTPIDTRRRVSPVNREATLTRIWVAAAQYRRPSFGAAGALEILCAEAMDDDDAAFPVTDGGRCSSARRIAGAGACQSRGIRPLRSPRLHASSRLSASSAWRGMYAHLQPRPELDSQPTQVEGVNYGQNAAVGEVY